MATNEQIATITHFQIKVDGSPISSEIDNKMLEAIVENSVHMPDLCILRFEDYDLALLNSSSPFEEGKSIEVAVRPEADSEVQVFKGEIVGIEADIAGHGVPVLIVRALALSHRLHRGRRRRTFQEMTDSDIIQQVCGDIGVPCEIESTSTVRHWVCQNNQTNWEFIQELARRNASRLFCFDKVYLKRHSSEESQSANARTVQYGVGLRSFRPRTNTHVQPSRITTRCWDGLHKEVVQAEWSRGDAVPQIGGPNQGGQRASSTFRGDTEYSIVDKGYHDSSDAEMYARSVANELYGSFIEADGLIEGDPNIRAGSWLNVEDVGDRFGGKYYLTSTTHSFTRAEGYSTQFTCTGTQPYTIDSLLEASDLTRSAVGWNVAVGIITDNKDPNNLARVKVKYPWLSDDDQSYWAKICAPMAGNNRGFQFIPEIDDEVLVAFEHGDFHRPYILGGLWNIPEPPPMPTDEAVPGEVDVRRLQSRLGHMLEFNDAADGGGAKLETAEGRRLVLGDKSDKITLTDQQGNEMTIETTGGNITIQCTGDFKVNAQGHVEIVGQLGATLKTPAQLLLEGQASADLKSSGIVTINGSMVKIN